MTETNNKQPNWGALDALLDSKKTEQEELAKPSFLTPKIYPNTGDLFSTHPSHSVDCCVADISGGPLPLTPILSNLFRLVKPNHHIYLLGSLSTHLQIPKLVSKSFPTRIVYRYPIIWVRTGLKDGQIIPSGTILPEDRYYPRQNYTIITMIANLVDSSQEPRKLTKSGQPNVIFAHNTPDWHTVPEEVYLNLFQRSCLPGEIILDPFFRPGNSILAGMKAGYKMIGSSTNPNNVEQLNNKLEKM